MIAYIREQGAKISREGRRLIVTTPDMKRTLSMDCLEQLLLFGNVQLTPPAMLLLLRESENHYQKLMTTAMDFLHADEGSLPQFPHMDWRALLLP